MQSSNYYQPNPQQQQYMMQPPIVDDSLHAAGGEEDDSDGSGIPDKRSGRRKIKIEYINDKSRRHITFSKRKAGIMKKAYELSTLTGTQVLLLVVSETGLVYTFTTPKLQPLVTKPEGKNLIQSCLNAPDPLETSSSSTMDHHQQQQLNSRSIMSSTAPTSPSTTGNNNSYYRANTSLDNSNYNSSNEDRKAFGSIVASNPSLMFNNTADQQQQMTSNYSMPYGYGTNTSANNSSATTGSLYPYENKYWSGNVANAAAANSKRPDSNRR